MRSSDLPESHQPVAATNNHLSPTAAQMSIDRRYEALRSGPLLLSYLVLLRAGFTLPSPSLSRRCALTAPFHPYPAWRDGMFSVALSMPEAYAPIARRSSSNPRC